MSTGRARALASGLVVLSCMLLVGGYAGELAADAFEFRWPKAFIIVITVAFAAVGALVAARHSHNAIGWIFLGVAVFSGLAELAHGYAAYRLDAGSTAGSMGAAAAVYAEVSWVPFVLVPSTFLVLLFPDGKLPSRRWAPVAWAAGVGIAGTFVISALQPGQLEDFPALRNPYGVEGALLEALGVLSYLALPVGVVGSAASIVVRFRRGTHEQRQQIKWLALAGGAGAPVTAVVLIFLYDILGKDVANALLMLSVLGLPAAAGIAILRHRLYDIDVVINRALVYGGLTATLAAMYLASVLLLQLALSPVTADNGLAVAASTLAVAALFRPARRRIQQAVDRRFYRRKYDAQRTLEAFAARLRDEVALNALSRELCAVVADTMQPAHVSLWLRPADGPVAGPRSPARAETRS